MMNGQRKAERRDRVRYREEVATRRAWEEQMAHNRTPLARVEGDDTFWYGTPEQIAERMRACA